MTDDGASPATGTGTEISTPSRAWRVRADAWDFLGYAMKQLTATAFSAGQAAPAKAMIPGNAGPAGKQSGLKDQVRRALLLLETIELYWAYPGLQTLARLRGSIAAGEYSEAFELIESVRSRICRIRSAPEQGRQGQEPADGMDNEPLEGRQDAPERPKFEVLVVDDITVEERRR
jgi:arginine decarboxylase